MKNTKFMSELNDLEKNAIYAGSKCIAFKEADTACTLNTDNPKWIHIWFIAKVV